MAEQKIAILGGGMGALAAAFALTSTAELRARYEITVYQLGWRLGGKGASGRDPRAEYGRRVYEHGLHVWAGFYENAFRMMRDCYAAWPRPDGARLSVWYDPDHAEQSAFLPQSFVVFEEELHGDWVHWFMRMPETPQLPGDGRPLELDVRSVLRETLEFAAEFLSSAVSSHLPDVDPRVFEPVLASFPGPGSGRGKALGASIARALQELPLGAAGGARRGPVSPTRGTASDRGSGSPLLEAVDRFHDWLARGLDEIGLDDALRRIWIVADLALTTARGLVSDRVLERGLDALDDIDWSAWLERHGISEITLRSPLVRGIYDYVFGYEEGDTSRRGLAAGTAIHGIGRLLFTYKGALFWQMQAAMGEVVITPLFEVLRARGVRFEFFQRVKGLHLSDDGSHLDRIDIGVQATLVDPARGYEPLVRVGDIDAWPDRPHVDQLVEGAEIAVRGVDLESPWSGWQDVGERVLERGRDFDVVVLGISHGALPAIAGELSDASPRWRDLLTRVKVVQTQAMQLWLTADKTELGWTGPQALLTAYAEPFNTWGDLSHLRDVERWPRGEARSIAYFVGPLPTMRPGADTTEFERQAREAVKARGRGWLGEHAGHLWPNATTTDNPAGLDWELLVDPEERAGGDRLEAQYFRANVNPSDAYVLSLPGTGRYRLAAGDSGFSNLYLAGDWVKTSIDAGCIEAAVMAGLAASRAISGYPEAIPGELEPARPAVPSQTSALGYPEYIERGGDPCFRQPLALSGVELQGFVLDADLDALRSLCARQLDAAAGGRVRYVPLIPKVVLVAAQIGQATSRDPRDSTFGKTHETDVGFWVPVGVVEPEPGKPDGRIVDLAWFLPYLWVDNAWAMVTGREIYGFPKGLATFEFPTGPRGGAVRVRTLALNPYDPATVARDALLLDVRREDDGATGLRRIWNDARDALGEVFHGVIGPSDVLRLLHTDDVDVKALVIRLFEHLGAGSVPLVFLKQFRDVADPTRACYRRVVTARAEVEPGSVRGAGPLWGDYVLDVAHLDSDPVARDLGLAVGRNRIDHAFWIAFDFTMQAGREV